MPRKTFHRSRYQRYRGGPDPLAPPADVGDAINDIAADVMAGASPTLALREYLRRGTASARGLDKLREMVNRRRRDLLENRNLDGVFREIRELLDRAVLDERRQLARDLDDDARFAEMQMASLPASTAEAVRELDGYDWRSPSAREAYDQIRDRLGRQMLDQRFDGMKQAMENATDADRRHIAAMLDDLNNLLAKHNRGDDTTAEFAEFMAEHGQFFPDNPRDTAELIDSLARRSAAAQQFYNSLSPEQRAELDSLAQQAFGSPELMAQLAAMDSQLRAARPDLDWDNAQDFSGSQAMGMAESTAVLGDLAELDALSEQLSQQYAGADLADIDLDALTRQLDSQAAADVRMLAELDKALKEQGFFERTGDGGLALSPKAMRRLGQTIIRDIADHVSGYRGERETRSTGAAGEASGSTRPWEFGDTEPWDVTATVTNAVRRTVADNPRRFSAAGALTHGVRIDMGDVEVSEMRARTQSAVALLVDTSFSMEMEGRWVPMKRTAIALNHLVSTRFRHDELQIVAFGPYARTVGIGELTGLQPRVEQGTNLHHALMLAGRHVRRYPHAQPVVLVVTDGEPTAHLESDGSPFFCYPPHPVTIALTVRELDSIARFGAHITFFRLGDDPLLERFVDRMARRIGGRVVAPDIDGLGAAVVGDYLRARRRRR